MAKLIENNFHQMDFGKVHKKALDSCKELKEAINKMKNLTKEPQNFIEEYFNKIINEIDLLREENKLKIDKCYEECFNEIQMYKNDCILNLKKDFTAKNLIIENFESELEFWQKKLQIPELTDVDYSFQNINSNVDSSCLALAKYLEGLTDDLLFGQDYKLEDHVKNMSCQNLVKIKVHKKVNALKEIY